ncbi:hypothetical protein MTO96_011070 [Rhipicephalus appendiculatus]
MEAGRAWNEATSSLTGSRRFVAGRARQRAVRKAVALLAFLAACCVLSRIRTREYDVNNHTARNDVFYVIRMGLQRAQIPFPIVSL